MVEKKSISLDKIKGFAATGLVALTVTSGALFLQDIAGAQGYFNGHVYEFASTHKELELQEKKFYEETGLIVGKMSFWDKYVYGKALENGYIGN